MSQAPAFPQLFGHCAPVISTSFRGNRQEMLNYELLKNDAGIALFADYLSLRRVHEILHDVNDRSPLIRDKEGFFLSLAFDIRKAYEGQRLKRKSDALHPEVGTRLGVQLLWP